MLNDLTLRALSPEETLRAIFAQAFAGEAVHLPAGGTVAALRAAMGLDDAIVTAIFQDVRAQARPEPLIFAVEEEAKQRSSWVYILGAFAIVILVAFGVVASRIKPVSTGRLYAQAMTDKASYHRLLKRAAHGDAAAAFDAGTLLDTDFMKSETVTPKDNAAAAAMYQAAAGRGFAPAETNLGHAYQTGHGVALSDSMAAHWFSLAATAGLADAQNSLGNIYQSGLGVPRDGAAAVQWYKKAAAQGLAPAENNLGAAYEAGFGAAQNYALAAWWFMQAATQGEPDAEERLGFLYFKGFGVGQSDPQAFRWFSAAAAQGLPSAQVNLGLLYAQGRGVKPNRVAAAKWYLLALARGDAQGSTALGQISPPLSPAQLAAAQNAAMTWKAAP